MFYEPWCKCNLKEWLRNPTIMGHTSNSVVRHCGIQYMLCMSAALHNLHSLIHPIIHRDLKPENILIDNGNKLCFVDFGVGKLCTSSTVSKSYIGTEMYLAPEVLHRNPHSRTAEVFSLGSIFVEILTVMSGTQAHAVQVFRRNRPYAERPQKTLAWMEGLIKLDASLSPYVAIVRDMLDLRPLNRPAFWEIHERIRQAALAEGLTFSCCGNELPEEDEAEYSDGTEAIESASSDDADELMRKLRLPLGPGH